jgi:hypothetical protein
MKVLIIGATGFIGRSLVKRLLEEEHKVTVFTRNHAKARKLFGDRVYIQQWKTDDYIILQEFAHKVEVVINLAGENLAGSRWTSHQKRKILSSRVNIGKAISFALKQSHEKPYLLIQASAIGYYGFSETEEFTEDSPNGEGFMPMVTRQWEDSVRNVEEDNTRKVFIRSGVVLGNEGGFLPKMIKPFRLFTGAYPGSGKQWISWIHIEDEINAIIELMEDEQSNGYYNLTAPEPVRMKTFAKILAKVLRKPLWFKIPGWLLKMIMGNMAKEAILKGQKVIPKKLQEKEFDFKYPGLEGALKNLVSKD